MGGEILRQRAWDTSIGRQWWDQFSRWDLNDLRAVRRPLSQQVPATVESTGSIL